MLIIMISSTVVQLLMLLNSLIAQMPSSPFFPAALTALPILALPAFPNSPPNVSKRLRRSILRCAAFHLPPLLHPLPSLLPPLPLLLPPLPPLVQPLQYVLPITFWLGNVANYDEQHRRANFDASQFPDCPDAILALLPGCINSPSDNCFASISQFPPKCLEEIKKVHPGLRGLPSGN